MREEQNQPCANHVAGNKQTEYFEEAYLPLQADTPVLEGNTNMYVGCPENTFDYFST